ncbi:E3 ubiquitin/ISG15 ligase TRIM25-like [Rhinophrynus dorsalis]
MASVKLIEELNCSICLSIYTNPVMLKCGHNFCQDCISCVLNSQEETGVYSCPECRAQFHKRPELQRIKKLCNIVEHFLSIQPNHDGSEIMCTYCVSSPVPAAKTCIHCEASLCDMHLIAHSKSVEHILIDPSATPQNRKCSIHNENLRWYCLVDKSCICASCCLIGEHQGHKVELMNEASKKRETQLNIFLKNLTTDRESVENTLKTLHKHVAYVQERSTGLQDQVMGLFGDIRANLQILEDKTLSEITRQKDKILQQTDFQIHQLMLKNDVLCAKMQQVEDICRSKDPFALLSLHRSMDEDLVDYGKKDHVEDSNLLCLDEVLISVTLQSLLSKLSCILPKLKANRGFNLQDDSDILLDINTVASDLDLTADLREATYKSSQQPLLARTEPFESRQVLSTKHFTSGQHYWEVNVSKKGNWSIAVAYASMKRKGDKSLVGCNVKSWCMTLFCGNPVAYHNSKWEVIITEAPLLKIGVYLDYDAGRLSFYEPSVPVRHLYTFNVTFTEPLHAAFYVYQNGWIRIGSCEC